VTRLAGTGSNSRSRKKPPASLRLTGMQASGRDGVRLVYAEESGEEKSWLLDQTSVLELFALLLRGRMRKGRRLVLDDVEVTLEPPEKARAGPLLCFVSDPLEICATLDRKTLTALRGEIDQVLKTRR
jgi:hypothetical protein